MAHSSKECGSHAIDLCESLSVRRFVLEARLFEGTSHSFGEGTNRRLVRSEMLIAGNKDKQASRCDELNGCPRGTGSPPS